MAITKMIMSKSSHNLVHYILDGKAHNKKFTTERNLFVGGHNIFTDYAGKINSNYIDAQYYAVRKIAGKTDKKTQAFHNIYSFSEDDFPDTTDKKELKKQAKQAYKLVSSFLKEQLPDDAQYLIGIQKDGNGGKLHAHVAINSVLLNGKVLDTNNLSLVNKITVLKKNKQVTKTRSAGLFQRMQDFFEKHFPAITGRKYTRIERQTDNLVNAKAVQMDARGAYIWKEDLKDRITDCVQQSNSLDEFKQNLKDVYAVDIKEYESSTGQVDANGNKIKRLAYTYSFKDDNGKLHKSRDFHMTHKGAVRGLGTFTRPDDLNNFIQKRLQQEQEQQRQADLELLQEQSNLKLQKADVINNDNQTRKPASGQSRTDSEEDYSSTPEYAPTVKKVKRVEIKQSNVAKIDTTEYDKHTRQLEQRNNEEIARRQQQANADAERERIKRERERKERELKRKQLAKQREQQRRQAERYKETADNAKKQANSILEQSDDIKPEPARNEPDPWELS